MTKNKNSRVHIALDLDKTLAYYESSWRAKKIGEPISAMLEKVKEWLTKGYKVTIFTARLSHVGEEFERQQGMIREFLKSCGLGHLPMTCVKKTEFTHFVDDKAYKVVPNKGEIETFLDL